MKYNFSNFLLIFSKPQTEKNINISDDIFSNFLEPQKEMLLIENEQKCDLFERISHIINETLSFSHEQKQKLNFETNNNQSKIRDIFIKKDIINNGNVSTYEISVLDPNNELIIKKSVHYDRKKDIVKTEFEQRHDWKVLHDYLNIIEENIKEIKKDHVINKIKIINESLRDSIMKNSTLNFTRPN